MFFDGAVKNDLIIKNPLIAINIPRSTKETKEIEILTLDQQKSYIYNPQHPHLTEDYY